MNKMDVNLNKESESEEPASSVKDDTQIISSSNLDQPEFYTPETRMYYPTTGIRPIRPSYLALASDEPVQLEKPRKILVILDLNGTLFHRPSKKSRKIDPRPFLHDFLRFLFKNCRVMIWSSARSSSVDDMLKRGFGEKMKLIDRIWDRSHFRLHEDDYNRKVLTLKDLEFVWEEVEAERKSASQEELKEGEKYGMHYDQTNTVLIDDSIHKSQLQPYNRIVLSDFDKAQSKSKADHELLKVKSYLEKLLTQQNLSAYIKRQPFDSVSIQFDLEEAIAMASKSKKSKIKRSLDNSIGTPGTSDLKNEARLAKRSALKSKKAKVITNNTLLVTSNNGEHD